MARGTVIEEIINEVRKQVSQSLDPMDDVKVMQIIEESVFTSTDLGQLNPVETYNTVERIFCAIRKDLDILERYAVDPEVSEIMVNGRENIFVERRGKIDKVDVAFDSTEALEEVIRRVAAKVYREINELNPIVDARLEDGSRINAVYKNIALGGPILTIRKFPETAYVMEDLINFGTVTEECAKALKILVEAGYNCFVSGGTSSGKTTFLNVLSNYIPSTERVIIIEDSAELQIKNIDNLVRMECKNANSEGRGQISMDKLIKTSLRMRPDRIIVGEVRGKEVLDMIQAMNTGHDGSLSSGHGNSIGGMLRRLESMFLQAANFPVDAIRAQIAEGIDIVIHMGRLANSSRRVLEIAEILGVEDGRIRTNCLFELDGEHGLVRTENKIAHREKLTWWGGENCAGL